MLIAGFAMKQFLELSSNRIVSVIRQRRGNETIGKLVSVSPKRRKDAASELRL